MEYVILIVGLAAVFAAWDGFRRSLLSASLALDLAREIKVLAVRIERADDDARERYRQFESAHLVQKNHLAELKSFINSQRKTR